MLDVIVQARDRQLFHAITDCGAGGFSSAVGEMGAELGAAVDLDRAPLKYQGLSYTEIWISEAQERMVLAVPPEKWPALKELCDSEGVEATDLGEFVDSGRLTLRYQGRAGRRPLDGLPARRPAGGRPRGDVDAARGTAGAIARRAAISRPTCSRCLRTGTSAARNGSSASTTTRSRRRTVIKPLVGACDDGPGDAAVVLPVRGSTRGLAVGCGINPRYGKTRPLSQWRPASSTRRFATAWPSAPIPSGSPSSTISAGATPSGPRHWARWCWRREACHDLALAYGTPFISGKDSLNNEYTHEGRSLAIPPTLLISAIGQVPDVRRCVTMDLKEPGNLHSARGHDPSRAGRVALGRRARSARRGPRAPGRSRAGPALVRAPCTRRSAAAWSEAATT